MFLTSISDSEALLDSDGGIFYDLFILDAQLVSDYTIKISKKH